MQITESNVTIMVKDMDRAVSFYQSIGLTLKNRWENHYAQLATTDIVIGLHPEEKELANTPKVSIGFIVDSIAEAKALLERNSIIYRYAEGKSGKYTHFNDPNGTYLYFSEPAWR